MTYVLVDIVNEVVVAYNKEVPLIVAYTLIVRNTSHWLGLGLGKLVVEFLSLLPLSFSKKQK